MDFGDAALEVAERVALTGIETGILHNNTGTWANNANVLALSIRFCGEKLLKEIIDILLATEPSRE